MFFVPIRIQKKISTFLFLFCIKQCKKIFKKRTLFYKNISPNSKCSISVAWHVVMWTLLPPGGGHWYVFIYVIIETSIFISICEKFPDNQNWSRHRYQCAHITIPLFVLLFTFPANILSVPCLRKLYKLKENIICCFYIFWMLQQYIMLYVGIDPDGLYACKKGESSVCVFKVIL